MADNGVDSNGKYKFYKVCLTGGPCGGKTTGQARLSTFFENLGWKVFRAPEAAYVFIGGGVWFPDLNEEDVYQFEEDTIKTIMHVEDTFQKFADSYQKNVLLICDRGVMDCVSYLSKEAWEEMKGRNNWNDVDLRDKRYNQVIHMVSAANGAEDFYTVQGHLTRYDNLQTARTSDVATAKAWVGHPYFDVVDNSTGFEDKISRMISIICTRIGIELGDMLAPNSIKRKYLVDKIPEDSVFPHYQEFNVVHDYLVTPNRKMQARIRRRGQDGIWTYAHTIRHPEINQQSVEVQMPVSKREYEILMAQKDDGRLSVYKLRRYFLWHNHYFKLDIFQTACTNKCKGLMLLETFTAKESDSITLPYFIIVAKEVTDDPSFSMYNLSFKD